MTTTPPRTVLPPQQDQSTPYNTGSASHESYQDNHNQVDYKPYLEVDIADPPIIPFYDFLHVAFGTPMDNQLKSKIKLIADSQDFQKRLVNYMVEVNKEEGAHETKMYHPFSTLANHTLENLSPPDDPPIIICRNDHIPIKGSSAQRIPDCVAVHRSAFYYQDRSHWDNLIEDGPKDNPFYWHELLNFMEFKLEPKGVEKPPTRARAGAGATASSHMPSSSQRKVSGVQSSGRGSRASAAASSARHSHSTSLAPSAATSSSTSPSSQKRRREDFEIPSDRKRSKKYKHSKPLEREDVLTQCASYALEMLSHGGLRSYVFGALITDSTLELLYYDHSRHVRSDPVCFREEPVHLISWLYCLRQLTPHGWGHIAPIERTLNSPPPPAATTRSGRTVTLTYIPSAPHHPLDRATLTLKDGTVLELGQVVFQQHALIGRGTFVFRAKDVSTPKKENWPDDIIIKISFIPDTRTSEGDILKEITDLATLDDVSMLNHIPKILHHETIAPGDTDAQSRLSAYLKAMDISYEYRLLQILVMTELFPITELTTTALLAPAIREVFNCYRWVYERAGFIHRDISLNNIMYRKKAGGGVYGVLSDFDLALRLKDVTGGPTSKQRTGTKPYMAIDLLQPIPPIHLYRHDLESLFYVVVLLTSRYHDGQKITEKDPFEDWFKLGMEALAKEKRNFITKRAMRPTANFLKVRLWTQSMAEMFNDGFTSRMKHEGLIDEADIDPAKKESVPLYDDSTFGGLVNFEQFAQILSRRIEA